MLDGRLARADAICARRGVRLTDQRRQILRLVLAAPEPVGAYTLLDRLRDEGTRAQPPTVYRALDFLLAQGLVHRLERLNAFVGCHDDAEHDHAAQFLLCAECGRAEEVEDPAIAAAITTAAASRGFKPQRAIIELEGTCAECAATHPGA